ncbi:GILT-like protein 1 [Nilaparvata lugens]|uniref:GILT-like protein 1 n=2 Tax=Nilaparvata lugens TaxID=108931 RepID=UPI00193D33F1|nr:GILT-like protein 1 [Nilaparvata lugens]
MIRSTLKANRSKLLFVGICAIIFIVYKSLFSTDSSVSKNEIADDASLNLKEDSLVHTFSQKKTKAKPVTISVFYECLCPDSRSFFLHHLLPSYERAPHLIDLDFVPYGKAKTYIEDGQYKFSCQHGSVECYGNKVHACSIAKVYDQTTLLALLSCMINDNMSPEERGMQCCRDHGVDWKPIQECAAGSEGDLLLKEHGESTDILRPPVSFIPTILLNKSQRDQRSILKNLWKELCKLFPQESIPDECLA